MLLAEQARWWVEALPDDRRDGPGGAGPADRRRAAWAPILLRVGLLIALLGLLAGGAWLLGPWSPERLRGLLAPAGPLAPARSPRWPA